MTLRIEKESRIISPLIKSRGNRAVQGIKKWLALQVAFALIVSFLVLLLLGKHQALSALLGASVALLPSLVFIKKFFKHQGAQSARQIVKDFYLGEGFKFIASLCCFTLVFLLYDDLAPLAFFATYVLMLMLHWLSPLVITKRSNRSEVD